MWLIFTEIQLATRKESDKYLAKTPKKTLKLGNFSGLTVKNGMLFTLVIEILYTSIY